MDAKKEIKIFLSFFLITFFILLIAAYVNYEPEILSASKVVAQDTFMRPPPDIDDNLSSNMTPIPKTPEEIFDQIDYMDFTVNDTVCQADLYYGTNGCTNTTPSPEFYDIKNLSNNIKKVEFTYLLTTFSIESLSSEPLFKIEDSYFILNDFQLTFGLLSWNSTTSGTLSDYQTIANNNQIIHCNNLTAFRILTDCYALADRIVYHVWYWTARQPDNLIKRAVHAIVVSIIDLFFDDNRFSDQVEITYLNGTTEDLDVEIYIQPDFIHQLKSTAPYSLPTGDYIGYIMVESSNKTYNLMIS